MRYRNKRVAAVIKQAVANIILNQLADPNFYLVTVTQARVSTDLKSATIFFSILGDKKHQNRVLDHLNRAKGKIRHLLGEQVTLRYLPQLDFQLDTLLLAERRIGEILNGLNPPTPRDA